MEQSFAGRVIFTYRLFELIKKEILLWVYVSGRRRIWTSAGLSRQIYSLLPLSAWVSSPWSVPEISTSLASVDSNHTCIRTSDVPDVGTSFACNTHYVVFLPQGGLQGVAKKHSKKETTTTHECYRAQLFQLSVYHIMPDLCYSRYIKIPASARWKPKEH